MRVDLSEVRLYGEPLRGRLPFFVSTASVQTRPVSAPRYAGASGRAALDARRRPAAQKSSSSASMRRFHRQASAAGGSSSAAARSGKRAGSRSAPNTPPSMPSAAAQAGRAWNGAPHCAGERPLSGVNGVWVLQWAVFIG